MDCIQVMLVATQRYNIHFTRGWRRGQSPHPCVNICTLEPRAYNTRTPMRRSKSCLSMPIIPSRLLTLVFWFHLQMSQPHLRHHLQQRLSTLNSSANDDQPEVAILPQPKITSSKSIHVLLIRLKATRRGPGRPRDGPVLASACPDYLPFQLSRPAFRVLPRAHYKMLNRSSSDCGVE
jgi:hypothetical protein